MIRLATCEDLENIARIHVDNRRNTYVNILSRDYLSMINYENAYIKWYNYFNKEDRAILVYEKNKQVIGFAAIKFYENEVDCGLLDHLHVSRLWRGCGFGTALIRASASILNQMQITKMAINIVVGNDYAESLYIKKGAIFRKTFYDDFSGYKVLSRQYIWLKIDKLIDNKKYIHNQCEYEHIYKLLQGKFCLWGSGDYCDIFLERFGENCLPEAIYDIDSSKWGNQKKGIWIKKPSMCKAVIITSRFYKEIENSVINMGCFEYAKFYPWHNYTIDMT